MDILLVTLRLLHIVAAFAWIGLGITSVFYIGPTVAASGEGGMRFLKTLLTRTNYPIMFSVAAGITMLAGILLYVMGSMNHFSTTGNIVLGIGAVAGILAGIHGGAVTGRATRALGEALGQYVPDGNEPISSDGLGVLRERAQAFTSHSRISVILMIIALVGMGSARYL
jgi:hypothetical protein